MVRKKYPLDPLLTVRERAADDAKAELGAAVRSRAAAEAEAARAEEARREAEARAAAARDDERAALERGELRVVDLARGDAWEVAAAAEAELHDTAVARASSAVSDARAKETDATRALAAREADHAVVARDHDRFRDKLRREEQQREDEAAEEAFAGGWTRQRDD